MPIIKLFQYKLHFRNRLISIFATIILLIGILVLIFFLVVPPSIAEFKKAGDLFIKFERKFDNDPLIPIRSEERRVGKEC